MPTIDRIDGALVIIYPNDHNPAHVHVEKGDRAAVVILNCPHGPLELRENFGFSRTELRHIFEKILSDLETFCTQWEKYHGPDRRNT
jgi:hypothetical protein